MSNNTSPEVRRFFVSRTSKVMSVMLPADKADSNPYPGVPMFKTREEAEHELATNPPKFQIKW